jgi:hypothetical protein
LTREIDIGVAWSSLSCRNLSYFKFDKLGSAFDWVIPICIPLKWTESMERAEAIEGAEHINDGRNPSTSLGSTKGGKA